VYAVCLAAWLNGLNGYDPATGHVPAHGTRFELGHKDNEMSHSPLGHLSHSSFW